MSLALVGATVLVTVGSTEASRIAKGQGPTAMPVVGGFALGIGLIAVTMINEELGTAFAILVLVTALLVNGSSLFALVPHTPGPVQFPTN